MFLHRPICIAFAVSVIFAACAAQADPLGFSVSTRDGVRTATVEPVSHNGVPYVPLGALVRQFGGGCEVTPERAQVDLAEKSAWLRSNNPQVSASLGVFLLGAPVVQTGNDILIAASDVAVFFEKAFRLAAKQQGPAQTQVGPAQTQVGPAQTQVGPAPVAAAPVTQLPLESEPQALEPLGAGTPMVEEVPLEPLEPLVQPGAEPPAPEPAGQAPEPDALEPLTVAQAAAPAAPAGPADRPVDRKFEVVVIDAGHGGADAGCAGPSGVAEADVALGVAQKLQQALEQAGLQTVMTREQTRALSRAERVFVANSRKGDVLISLHAGTAFDSGQRGCRVFVCGEDGAAAGCRYAGRSRGLAEAVSKAIGETTGAASGGVCELRCQVVQDVAMPGLMVEVGMLTNAEEERLLATDEYQTKIAAGIAAGVKKHIESGNTESTP